MRGEQGSIHSLKEAVLLSVDKGNSDQALRIIHNCVERIITEPLCTSQVFGSKTLDELCQRVGKANLAEIKDENTGATFRQQNKPVYVYIVTKLQKSGGHTRVIEDFIRAQAEGQHIILSTELDGRSDIDFLMDAERVEQNKATVERSPNVNYQQRLVWLQKRLLEIRPKRTYLFNHHHDSVAVAAIQPEMKLEASFYHHGDHHLCLGAYLPHLEHIDIHPMGYHYCRDKLGVDNVYVPLAVYDRGKRTAKLPFLHNGSLTTCTAARSNKIEVPYFVSYLDIVPEILKITGGKHIHIGRLSPWALLKLRRGLKRYGIPLDRFIYTPWVPSVWKALHKHQIDLYIASFPYGGGLTLIEAMGAGIPVAIHRHIFSRVLSGVDLAYSDAFNWRYPDELLNYCSSLTSGELEKSSRLARKQYEKFHSLEDLTKTLSDVVHNSPTPHKLSEEFSVENDEWALWVVNQSTMRKILSRIIYRLFRRFRASWQR